MKTFVSGMLILALAATPITSVYSNPIDPEVISGAVDFPEEFTELLEITQHSDKAIIHWQGFSISAGEVTKFIQPGANSTTLNRVISGDTSSIEGALEANGRLLLINPNGILFGAGARVDTNGFIASTLDVPDAQFLAGGDMRFSGGSQAPVVNLGTITAENGDVFLVGATVRNAGDISAPNGAVGLAAGQQVLITAQGDERLFVEVGSSGSVDHEGAIRAAQAELKAAGSAKALAVNVRGSVEATGVQRVGGRVLLSGGGGIVRVANRVRGETVRVEAAEVEIAPEGDLAAADIAVNATTRAQVDGRLRANDEIGGTGGSITVTAPEIAIGGTARVDASGAAAGGVVDLRAERLDVAAGAEIKANASVDGAGGLVMATAADSASIGGTLAARGRGAGSGGFVNVFGGDLTLTQTSRLDASGEVDGGFVTVDGTGNVAANGRVDARGQSGSGGFILVKSAGDLSVGATARLDAGGEIDGGFISVEGENDVAVHGQLLARGRTGNGGQIFVTGDGDVEIGLTGVLDASGGVDGGLIQVEGGGDVHVDGQLLARGEAGNGGQIFVTGEGAVSVGLTGVLDASGGVDGGFIAVEGGDTVSIGGRLSATGGSGAGGFISVTGENGVTIEQTGVLDASGATGGTIFVDSPNGDTAVHGSLSAVGNDGAGGHIEVTGENVLLGATANVDASGLTGGGRVLIGGDFQGKNPDVHNAVTTTVERGARIAVDALGAGPAGEAIVWADGRTFFGGHVSAAARSAAAGDGGFIEISGKQNLAFRGTVDLSSLGGVAGTLLLDPTRVIVVNGAAGAGANSGELADGTINAADGGAVDFTITTGDIAAFGGNVMIAATTEITDGGAALNIDNPSGSLTFDVTAGNINLGTSRIGANSADVTMNALAGTISYGVIDTRGTTAGSDAGSVSLTATDIAFGTIQAFGTDGDSGTPDAGDGGDVTLRTTGAPNTISGGGVLNYGGDGFDTNATTPGGAGGNGGTVTVDSGTLNAANINYFGGAGGDGNPSGLGGAPGMISTINGGAIGGGTIQNGGSGANGTLLTPGGGGGGASVPAPPKKEVIEITIGNTVFQLTEDDFAFPPPQPSANFGVLPQGLVDLFVGTVGQLEQNAGGTFSIANDNQNAPNPPPGPPKSAVIEIADTLAELIGLGISGDEIREFFESAFDPATADRVRRQQLLDELSRIARERGVSRFLIDRIVKDFDKIAEAVNDSLAGDDTKLGQLDALTQIVIRQGLSKFPELEDELRGRLGIGRLPIGIRDLLEAGKAAADEARRIQAEGERQSSNEASEPAGDFAARLIAQAGIIGLGPFLNLVENGKFELKDEQGRVVLVIDDPLGPLDDVASLFALKREELEMFEQRFQPDPALAVDSAQLAVDAARERLARARAEANRARSLDFDPATQTFQGLSFGDVERLLKLEELAEKELKEAERAARVAAENTANGFENPENPDARQTFLDNLAFDNAKRSLDETQAARLEAERKLAEVRDKADAFEDDPDRRLSQRLKELLEISLEKAERKAQETREAERDAEQKLDRMLDDRLGRQPVE